MPWSGGREAGEEATYSSLFRRERVAAWSGQVEAVGGGEQSTSQEIRWRKRQQDVPTDLLWKEGEGSAEKFLPHQYCLRAPRPRCIICRNSAKRKHEGPCLTSIGNFQTGMAEMWGLAEHGARSPHPGGA